mmetsp:Transcript_16695/g.25223  ORF Transcript_16695/g.25223 Transcript_16695/m.25223 type:complete len:106 (+) Transcript_16695:22-339(+)
MNFPIHTLNHSPLRVRDCPHSIGTYACNQGSGDVSPGTGDFKIGSNSCHGRFACGAIGSVEIGDNSCNGKLACCGWNGFLLSIASDTCNGDYACCNPDICGCVPE